MVHTQIHGKKSDTVPKKKKFRKFTRKEINKLLTTADQPPCFLYLVRFFGKSYLTSFLNIFKKTVYFVTTNQGFQLSDSCEFQQVITKLKLLQSFLHNGNQQVLLNGQSSTVAAVLAGVAQGSVLRPLFF